MVAAGREDFDLASDTHKKLRTLVRITPPQIVVNNSASTVVDRAGTEQDRAAAVNRPCACHNRRGVRQQGASVYYSTDYVFDGRKGSPTSSLTPRIRSMRMGAPSSKASGRCKTRLANT